MIDYFILMSKKLEQVLYMNLSYYKCFLYDRVNFTMQFYNIYSQLLKTVIYYLIYESNCITLILKSLSFFLMIRSLIKRDYKIISYHLLIIFDKVIIFFFHEVAIVSQT